MKARTIFGAICMMVMATCMVAQTTLRADIPFQFYAGDKALPAGSYSVLQVSDSATVLRLDDAGISRAIITHSTQRDAKEGKRVMVFQRIGGSYFLTQIWKDSGSNGRELARSKVQVEVARQGLPNSKVEVLMARK